MTSGSAGSKRSNSSISRGAHRGPIVAGCASHQRDEAVKRTAHVLTQQLHVGSGERGLDVVRRSVGDRGGVMPVGRRPHQERDLADSALGLGMVRVGIQDGLIGVECRTEVVVLELLAGLRELGVDLVGLIGIG